jgi:hypothetical protein
MPQNQLRALRSLLLLIKLPHKNLFLRLLRMTTMIILMQVGSTVSAAKTQRRDILMIPIPAHPRVAVRQEVDLM